MILAQLSDLRRCLCLHPGLGPALDFLDRPDLGTLAPGRHDIRHGGPGDALYAMVFQGPGRSRDQALLEVHDRYADIHLVLAGVDDMGWKPRQDCLRQSGEFDVAKDVGFFADEPDAWLSVRAGSVAVFFPEDAHMPMIATDELHKVVIKLAMEDF